MAQWKTTCMPASIKDRPFQAHKAQSLQNAALFRSCYQIIFLTGNHCVKVTVEADEQLSTFFVGDGGGRRSRTKIPVHEPTEASTVKKVITYIAEPFFEASTLAGCSDLACISYVCLQEVGFGLSWIPDIHDADSIFALLKELRDKVSPEKPSSTDNNTLRLLPTHSSWWLVHSVYRCGWLLLIWLTKEAQDRYQGLLSFFFFMISASCSADGGRVPSGG